MRVLQGDSQEGVGEAHLGSHCSVAMIPPRLCTSIQTVLWGLDLAIPSFTFFFSWRTRLLPLITLRSAL